MCVILITFNLELYERHFIKRIDGAVVNWFQYVDTKVHLLRKMFKSTSTT